MAQVRSFPTGGGLTSDEKVEREHWQRLSETLLALSHTESWDVYRGCLEDMEKAAIQKLINGTKDMHDHWVGYIDGLRAAFHLPETMQRQLTK